MERIQEGLLKQLVSGEPTQVNRKHKDPVTLYPTAKLYFGTNTLPPIADTSDGMWRRMITMPFLQRFDGESCDRQRAQRLQAEIPGILTWALLGGVCEQHKATYRVESDPFLQFVDEWCVTGVDVRTEVDEIYAAYRQFCDESGRRPKGKSEFGKQALAVPSVCKVRGNIHGRRTWMYTGLALAPGVAASNARRRILAERPTT
jgi:putative DNA primase/helicase